jgi:methionyl-tRNA formyltransferase
MLDIAAVKVALLAPPTSSLLPWLREYGEQVVQTDAPIDAAWLEANAIEFLVSFDYQHILRADVLDRLPGAAVNLHISLLPYNRGSDPNLWSFLEDTPKGVTVHHMDVGVDTGDIIGQREVELDPAGTLASTHAVLRAELEDLFGELWPALRARSAPRRKQPAGGTVHKRAESEAWFGHLHAGWDTPVAGLIGLALAPGDSPEARQRP